MKGIFACSLISCSLLTLSVHAETVIPVGSSLSVNSALEDSGFLLINGSLQTTAANVLHPTSPLYLNAGGSVDLQNLQQSAGSVSGAGSIHLGSAALGEGTGLVRLGGGRLVVGANSGFSGTASGGSVTVGGVTVTSGATGAGVMTSVGGSVTTGASKLQGGGGSGGTLSSNVTDSTLTYYTSAAASNGNTYNYSSTFSSDLFSSDLVLTLAGGSDLTSFSLIPNGTFTLTGTNTFNGVLNIVGGAASSGTLALAGGNTLSHAFSLNGGSLVFSGTSYAGTTFTISGTGGTLSNTTGAPIVLGGTDVILGNGQTVLWSNSDGIVTFTGTDGSLLGTTTLSGTSFPLTVGTSALRDAAARPALDRMAAPDSVPTSTSSTNGVLITGNDNTNQIFSGSITGNGSVIKTGTGAWYLTGNNTFNGLTTIANGALVIDGSIASDVYVWGGVLGGSGRIGGSVLNQSVVSPGNSPGTLTIAGDYDQASTGVLWIQIASASSYDRLVVGGQAHLDGTLVAELIDGATLRRGQTYTILTAAGGVSGEFAQSYVSRTGTLLSLGVVYLADGVVLQTIQGSFANDVPGLTANERAVATALDKVVDSSRVAGLVDQLDTLPIGSIPSALEKIVPTQLLAMFDASIAASTVQADNLERRLEEVRNGSVISTGGLHLTDSRGTVSGRGDGKQAIGKDGKELEPAPLSDRWGYFINGSGEFVDTESTAAALGTDFTTGGISAGADYRFGEHAVAGVTAGYANTKTGARNDDSVKINSGKLGLYGTVFSKGFFLNGGVAGGLNSYDTKRDTVGGNATGDTEGTEFNTLLGTGYTCKTGGWSFGPVASLRYSWVGIDGFTEHGSLAPLRYNDQSEDSLRSTAGAQISYAIQAGKIVVTPSLRAQWQHEYLDSSRGIGASFLPGGAFSVSGPEVGRDSLLLDAGVTVQLTARVGVYAAYTGELFRDNYSDQSVNGGVQVQF